VPSASFLDSLVRQIDMSHRDLTMRLVSVTASFAFGTVIVDPHLMFLLYLLYATSEIIGAASILHLKRGFSRVWYAVQFLSCAIGSAALMVVPVMAWSHHSGAAAVFAFAVFFGSIMHVIVVRSYHLPLTLAIILPIMVAGLIIAQQEMNDETDPAIYLSAMGAFLVLCFYVTRGIFEMHRMRQSLVAARNTAEEASRAKSRFVASMSHEIRTPLNGILGVAQLAVEDAQTAREKDRAEVLYSSALTLRALVDDVLDHAKIEAGKMQIKPGPTDIRQLVHTVTRLFADLARAKGLEQQVKIDPDIPPLLLMDGLRVRQIVSNLMSNAIKFTDAGRICLHLFRYNTPSGDHICFEVKDTGQGMTLADQAQLFRSFSQVDTNTERAAGGTGLGLVISRGLAQMMNGDLTVQSKVGHGTKFCFAMPLVLPDPLTAQAMPGPAPDQINALAALSLTAQRVLLVDDNRANRMIARAFLEKAQMHVTEADSGASALAFLRTKDCDLVLLDMHMPDLSGLETLEQLRTLPLPAGNVPVIALTADAAAEDREFYLSSGLDGYLSKPLSKTDMFHEIARVLRRHAVAELAAE